MARIIVDCDPGIDDAVAILTGLGLETLTIEAITTVAGNLPSDAGAQNALRILELAGRTDIPVAQGAMHPLTTPLPPDPFSHGSDGLGETNLPTPTTTIDSRPAYELIVELANANPGEITVVALGPFTNLALALREDPDLPQKLAGVVAIAGTYGINEYGSRNATGDNPTSEWNVFVDPEAAAAVVDAGFELTLIGLDIAAHPANNLGELHIRRLDSSQAPSAQFTAAIVRFVLGRGFNSHCSLIDPLAVLYAAEPSLFAAEEMSVGVETEGRLTRGQTVVDRREHFRWGHLAKVAVVIDADHAKAVDLIVDTVTSPRVTSVESASALRGPNG